MKVASSRPDDLFDRGAHQNRVNLNLNYHYHLTSITISSSQTIRFNRSLCMDFTLLQCSCLDTEYHKSMTLGARSCSTNKFLTSPSSFSRYNHVRLLCIGDEHHLFYVYRHYTLYGVQSDVQAFRRRDCASSPNPCPL